MDLYHFEPDEWAHLLRHQSISDSISNKQYLSLVCSATGSTSLLRTVKGKWAYTQYSWWESERVDSEEKINGNRSANDWGKLIIQCGNLLPLLTHFPWRLTVRDTNLSLICCLSITYINTCCWCTNTSHPSEKSEDDDENGEKFRRVAETKDAWLSLSVRGWKTFPISLNSRNFPTFIAFHVELK